MADIEKTKATEAEKTEYTEPDMRPEKLIKQQEREAKMTPDELYAELKVRLDKAFTAEEAAEIDKAFRVAREAHKAQLRYSGQPYIIHPIAVSNILLDLGMDAQSVEAALLHDTVEDTDITLDYIKPDFGDAVTVKPGETPVFWACGVTPQSIMMNSKPDFCITHAPGHMLITDIKNTDLKF